MPDRALKYLPAAVRAAVNKCTFKTGICEIRLRSDLPLSFTTRTGNLFIGPDGKEAAPENALTVTKKDVETSMNLLCEGSVYRYTDDLREGFITTAEGLRAGFCGSFSERSEIPLSEITGINVRIPRNVPDACDGLLGFFYGKPLASALVFSPPGAGKTTAMRSAAVRLSRGSVSRGPVKVCAVDTRGELFPPKSDFAKNAGMLDVMRGCGKARGISTAVRVMSPDVIICDEIGGDEETAPLLSASFAGVILFATAHARDFEELGSKPNLRLLTESGVFAYAARLSADGSGKTRFDFKKLPSGGTP